MSTAAIIFWTSLTREGGHPRLQEVSLGFPHKLQESQLLLGRGLSASWLENMPAEAEAHRGAGRCRSGDGGSRMDRGSGAQDRTVGRGGRDRPHPAMVLVRASYSARDPERLRAEAHRLGPVVETDTMPGDEGLAEDEGRAQATHHKDPNRKAEGTDDDRNIGTTKNVQVTSLARAEAMRSGEKAALRQNLAYKLRRGETHRAVGVQQSRDLRGGGANTHVNHSHLAVGPIGGRWPSHARAHANFSCSSVSSHYARPGKPPVAQVS